MFGPTELALILVLVLILFGAGKLPQVFESLGQGMKRFREAQNEPDPAPPEVRKPDVGSLSDDEKRRLMAELQSDRKATVTDAEEVKSRSA